ncbi:MAG: hypothetical protein K9N01_04355 [Cephaloticoccus sp.]|nr:hypothetical protein [Cephaloticoccus sp.]
MKTIKHIVLGLLASLLFAAGFARAADRVDLMASGITTTQSHPGMPSIGPCAAPCDDPPPDEGP